MTIEKIQTLILISPSATVARAFVNDLLKTKKITRYEANALRTIITQHFRTVPKHVQVLLTGWRRATTSREYDGTLTPLLVVNSRPRP